jgi:hypothetical protein
MSAGDLQHGEEEHGADAVVEERLARELRLNGFGDADAAMGSVGEMSAPKSRHSVHEVLPPVKSFMRPPTAKNEMMVPTTASNATGSFSSAS